MNKRPFTKAQRREIRRLASLSHERELGAAAGQLQAEFERWRRGEIHVFDLNERIHEFHDGISRDLYKFYAMGDAESCVASAIGRDVLQESEVDPAIVEGLRNTIEWVRKRLQVDENE